MVAHIETFNIKDLCTTLVKLTTEEPDAGKPLVRVCGGAGRQRTALPGKPRHSPELMFTREFHTSMSFKKVMKFSTQIMHS